MCYAGNRIRKFRDRFSARINHKFSILMIAALSRFVGQGQRVGSPAVRNNLSLETNNLPDRLGSARNPDF
jgi:hypothetical protein